MTIRASHPPTRLSLRDMRADALHRLLTSPRGEHVRTVTDIHALVDLRGWQRLAIAAAIADLLAAGKLNEDSAGTIRVAPREAGR